jgi:RNA 3'-terminal phosphate cyclase (ATP)
MMKAVRQKSGGGGMKRVTSPPPFPRGKGGGGGGVGEGGEFAEIDGSVMEGGGQILRMSVGLSALLSTPIRISNIRAGRASPGLKAQHLTGLTLVRDLAGGKLDGGEFGSVEVSFIPGQLRSGQFSADTQTAGAVCLLAQVSLPCALFSPGMVSLNLRGGTNAQMAPQIDEYTEIFLPNISKFGFDFEFEVVRKGFFPRGGGEVNFFLKPVKQLQPITMTSPGVVQSIIGWSFTAGNLPQRVAEQMTSAAKRQILEADVPALRGVPVRIETYKEDTSCAPHSGSGIVLLAKTSTGCILGGSALGAPRVSPEDTGAKAAEELLEAVESGGCVDKYIQDQMIIFMALAAGPSTLVTGPITLHTETAIHIAEKLTKAKFKISACHENNRAWVITCEGIGLVNHNL